MRYYFFLLILFSGVVFSQHRKSFYFDFNQSTFNSNQLENIQNWINENPNAEILKIEGFCDKVGSDAYNYKLADKRIISLLEKVIGNVFISENLKKNSFGKNFKQNDTLDLNRRVDVYYKINNFLKEFDQVQINSLLESFEVGKKIKLENIYFIGGKAEFVPESRPTLFQLLKTMRELPTLKIEIHGHICCASEDVNELSRDRAEAVYSFLINNGVLKKRMSFKSFGSSQPIFNIPEKNEDERNANRRVEILILEK